MSEDAIGRWTKRPPDSTWGDFGPDDQLGRLNLLDEKAVLLGMREVQVGKAFCLSLPLDYPGGNAVNPKRFPPVLQPTSHSDKSPYYNLVWKKYHPGFVDVSSDDSVLLHTQYSTQWDSFAHAGALFDADGDGVEEIVYYNGWRAGQDIRGPDDPKDRSCCGGSVQAARLGIETMAETCVQGRGVLIDLHAHWGTERRSVGFKDLEAVMATDGVVVEKGDILLIHTGWSQMILDMRKQPDAKKLHTSCAVLDSSDRTLLDWISEIGIAAIAADNFAVEDAHQVKPEGYVGPRLPLHNHCLFKLGVPLGELWYLTELANWLRRNGRSRCLITAPPLRLTGAVGSPVTPVATV